MSYLLLHRFTSATVVVVYLMLVRSIRCVALFVFCSIVVAQADIQSEAWPKVVCDFPHDLPSQVKSGASAITITAPRDESVREGGGSGGPMLTFNVRNQTNGWSTSFDDQSVGARLLEAYHGFPQLEVWVRGGGGSYSRCLHRFARGQYRCVRIDEFTAFKEAATNKAVTTTLTGREERLYFVKTRIPDDD